MILQRLTGNLCIILHFQVPCVEVNALMKTFKMKPLLFPVCLLNFYFLLLWDNMDCYVQQFYLLFVKSPLGWLLPRALHLIYFFKEMLSYKTILTIVSLTSPNELNFNRRNPEIP